MNPNKANDNEKAADNDAFSESSEPLFSSDKSYSSQKGLNDTQSDLFLDFALPPVPVVVETSTPEKKENVPAGISIPSSKKTESEELSPGIPFSLQPLRSRTPISAEATVHEAVTLQNRLRSSQGSVKDIVSGNETLLQVPKMRRKRQTTVSLYDEDSDYESDGFDEGLIPSPDYKLEANVNYQELEQLTGNPALLSSPFEQTFSKKFKKYNSKLRYTFFSQKTDMMQADSLFKLVDGKEELVSLLKDNIFWIDISCPTDLDMKIISKIFKVHPLTIEDMQTADTREKCEIFESYIFLCLRVCDDSSSSCGESEFTNIYIAMFGDYIFSIHFTPLSHIKNILRRLEHLSSYLQLTPDWIMYSIMDEVSDQFIPIIASMEVEIDTIDDLVLVLSESEQADLLKRIGGARKKVTALLRILRPKLDILKVLTKRSSGRIHPQVLLYLRDIQDHIIEMTQNLDHYSETLNRSHGNYLAQINIEITQASNRMNVVMKKFTAAASILLPLQLISGMWGMNVPVPGQSGTVFGDYVWFFSITLGMILIMFLLVVIGKRNRWL